VESRRINGKPTPIVVEYIGNTKKLYEKLRNNSVENLSLKSYSHGDTHGLMMIVRRLGIEKLLDDVFGEQTSDGIKKVEA
jgi:hypothetical protein